jgi:hypothetical protein
MIINPTFLRICFYNELHMAHLDALEEKYILWMARQLFP